MAKPLEAIARLCGSPAEAVRWSCVLEATAPKAGNVHPGQSFADLHYKHFVDAAEIASDAFSQIEFSTCHRAHQAASRTFAQTNTNVNLGILLLLAPLVAADESTLVAADESSRIQTLNDWSDAVATCLGSLTRADSESLFDAIRVSAAGGLGQVEEMDVNEKANAPRDVVSAMRMAKDRDRIARQYADSFQDLITCVVPTVQRCIDDAGDLLLGVTHAQIALLAEEPDTLIVRKCGQAKAKMVQQRAASVNIADAGSLQAFDSLLRSEGQSLNPGTTADLIAAALYILLRTPNEPKPQLTEELTL